MKVYIKLIDTLTLETEEMYAEMETFDKHGMHVLINSPAFHNDEPVCEEHIVEAFVVQKHQGSAAFIVRDTMEGAYGGQLVTGIVQLAC